MNSEAQIPPVERINENTRPTGQALTTGCELVRQEASKYSWDVDVVVAIAKAESNCNTNAIGDNYPINGVYAPSCGFMQIRTLAGRPSCEELQDPATNILWAYKVSGSGTSFKPWSVYQSGKYLKHL